VLLLGYPRGGRTHLVFTKRTETVQHHQGQISLPGGAREVVDSTLEVTALRETQEELGVSPAVVQVLGRLDDVYVRTSNFLIAPYVGAIDAAPVFQPDPGEVAQVIEVPLYRLRDPAIFREEDWAGDDGPRKMQFYQHGPHEIWGATARVLQLFLASEYPDLLVARYG
jgi:8-oxo-dGTP pyrophosphatase MutT (NUDIX family)